MNRPRNEKGKFAEYSSLGKKLISVRLFKADQDKFLAIAEELGVSPTELARQAINDWLKNKNPGKTIERKLFRE